MEYPLNRACHSYGIPNQPDVERRGTDLEILPCVAACESNSNVQARRKMRSAGVGAGSNGIPSGQGLPLLWGFGMG